MPLIILVNENSSGASEIVAAAIKHHKRGKIIGTKTAGKGSVQSIIPLDYNTGLRITIQKFYTPLGNPIQDNGVEPDIAVQSMEFSTEENELFQSPELNIMVNKYIDENSTFDPGSIDKFQVLLNKNGIKLNQKAAGFLLKKNIMTRESAKKGKFPLYDLDYDAQLLQAVSEFEAL